MSWEMRGNTDGHTVQNQQLFLSQDCKVISFKDGGFKNSNLIYSPVIWKGPLTPFFWIKEAENFSFFIIIFTSQ